MAIGQAAACSAKDGRKFRDLFRDSAGSFRDFGSFLFASTPNRHSLGVGKSIMISAGCVASRRGLEPLTPGLGSSSSGC